VGKTIQVTSAQVNAARLWIERADRDGTPIPEGIRKLANAAPRPVILHETTPTAVEASNGGGRADQPIAGAGAEDLDGSR
jgi:hypothetical protein